MPAKHDFGETFEREKFYRKTVRKGDLYNLVISLWKLKSQNVFEFIFYFHLFYTDGDRIQDSLCNNSSVWIDYIELSTRFNQF